MPFVLCFLLGIALTVVFFWRVASTDPSWNRPPERPQPVLEPVDLQSPSPSEEKTVPLSEQKAQDRAPVPSVVTQKSPEPVKAAPKAPSTDEINAYLSTHLGQKIPLLRGTVKRDVTLAAFTDDSIMVRAGANDLTTLPRASLSVDQLNLWKE